jgi:hypothetical protein
MQDTRGQDIRENKNKNKKSFYPDILMTARDFEKWDSDDRTYSV